MRTNNSKSLVIFGSGGHAISVANVALSSGYNIKYFIDCYKIGGNIHGYKILKNIYEIDNIYDYNYSIAIGSNFDRYFFYKSLINNFPDLFFPSLIHKSAVISSFSQISDGTVIMPNSIVGPNSKIGKFCIINTQSSIDHDSTMFDFSSIAPGAITGGSVEIGLRSAVSIGSTIKHGIKIGSDCVLGANSYLNINLPDNCLSYGSPARIIRNRTINDKYL